MNLSRQLFTAAQRFSELPLQIIITEIYSKKHPVQQGVFIFCNKWKNFGYKERVLLMLMSSARYSRQYTPYQVYYP